MAVKKEVDETVAIREPRLTEEVRSALAAPLDPKYLRQRKGSQGKMFTYADLDYLEGRATEVDPDWGAPTGLPMFQATNNTVVCNVSICGVPRSAAAGYYVPDEYDVWDGYKKEMVTRKMDARAAHTIVTAAQAASERRVFAMFGLGAELWAKNQEGVDEPIGPENATKQPARQSSNQNHYGSGDQANFREPSEGRVNMLVGFGIPESVAKHINSWSRGKGDDGYPISDVSETINALKAKRGKDKGPLDRRVWEEVVALHAPYALSAVSTGDDDEDDEWPA